MSDINTTSVKYFLYVRKSQDEKDRQVQSIPSQISEAKKRYPELEIIETFQEEASAFKPYNRPVFALMLQRIQAGEANGIIAWHPDRLSRNPIDGGQVTYLLDIGVIKDLKFTSFHFENTAEGKMLLGFMLSQSKYFSDKLSKDIRRGNMTKLENGVLPGKAPQGYKNVHLDNGHKDVIPFEPYFTQMRKAWDLLLSGVYSVAKIQREMNDKWGYRTALGKKISKSQLYFIFTNEFYCGWIDRKEGRYKGKHQTMITTDEFDRAQKILGAHGKPKPYKYEFAFTGMIHCGECNSMITAESKTHCYCYVCKRKFSITLKSNLCPLCKKSAYGDKMKLLNYTYYHCSKNKQGIKCSQPCISLKDLEYQVDTFFHDVEIPHAYTDWAIKWLKYKHQDEVNDHNTQLETLQKAYTATQDKLDALIDMRMNSLIDDNTYKAKRVEVEKERNSLREQLDGFEHRVNRWVDLTEEVLNFASNARSAFQKGDLKVKKQILSDLSSNLILKDGNLSLVPNEVFQIIAKRVKETPTLQKSFEPKIMPDVLGNKATLEAPFSKLCWE